MDHPVNVMIRDYNTFNKHVSRKVASRDIQEIIILGKRLGLNLKEADLSKESLKQNGNKMKEKVILHFCKVMQEQNKFEVDIGETGVRYN